MYLLLVYLSIVESDRISRLGLRQNYERTNRKDEPVRWAAL
ncbi:hypothetical protein [Dendronalium phyllosphericum]|nr:hypothetical protein [Dendronalium phyllosphericum]